MNIFNKNTNKPVHDLRKAEPTHHRWTRRDELKQFWVMNKTGIGVVIVGTCIGILIAMMGYAAATGHLHMFSTPQNVYEHLAEVVL